MPRDYRHHHIVLVPVPVGGVDFGRQAKPPAYKRNQPTHWRPAQHPPSKAERAARFLDSVARQEQEVRRFLEESRRHAG